MPNFCWPRHRLENELLLAIKLFDVTPGLTRSLSQISRKRESFRVKPGMTAPIPSSANVALIAAFFNPEGMTLL